MNKELRKILDESSNDELWVIMHFVLNHPEKIGDMHFLDTWKCEDCADFYFCKRKLSPSECADIAAVSPRLEYG